MKMPKMILFEYGQTLIAEQKFDGIKGTGTINEELERFDPQKRHLVQIEVPNTMFTPYLYESQGI